MQNYRIVVEALEKEMARINKDNIK